MFTHNILFTKFVSVNIFSAPSLTKHPRVKKLKPLQTPARLCTGRMKYITPQALAKGCLVYTSEIKQDTPAKVEIRRYIATLHTYNSTGIEINCWTNTNQVFVGQKNQDYFHRNPRCCKY